MTDTSRQDQALALGELRGLLNAFAWANGKCNHQCTFAVEELPGGGDLHTSLVKYFGDWANKVTVAEIENWPSAVGDALQRRLFLFVDLVKPNVSCALTHVESHRIMVDTVLRAFAVGLQPLAVSRVEVDLSGFYECDWDDFAIVGKSGHFLLHLGVSD